jgi:hypothetical protein
LFARDAFIREQRGGHCEAEQQKSQPNQQGQTMLLESVHRSPVEV